jgi:UDP-N-acetylglucosamine 2-epimerase (non-hydrolysing)
MEICCACGARPNFVKVAAVVRAMRAQPELVPSIVHTGQHYDERLCEAIFDDVGLPRPQVDLEVGSGSHAAQTAEVMKRFEPVLCHSEFDLVMVFGDVNSTLACALVAAKLDLPVAHVEAGLRSFDRSMPEELNRLLTDACSDLLFVSERSGLRNLRNEGVPDENVFFVGNVMIDTLLAQRERADRSGILERVGVAPKQYAVLTLHRPANVDDAETAGQILATLDDLRRRIPIVFPAHPRTRDRLEAHGLFKRARAAEGLHLLEPLGYLDFLKLMAEARLVMTDSGGIQEETTILGVPCLTLRETTERPATLEAGLNRLVGSDPARIKRAFEQVLDEETPPAKRPEKWDGRAGERIVELLMGFRDGDFPRR